VVRSFLLLALAFGPKGPPTRGDLMFFGYVYCCVLCVA
jgi:hypothetical protein